MLFCRREVRDSEEFHNIFQDSSATRTFKTTKIPEVHQHYAKVQMILDAYEVSKFG
jgi:beta-galactosidase beta subunit